MTRNQSNSYCLNGILVVVTLVCFTVSGCKKDEQPLSVPSSSVPEVAKQMTKPVQQQVSSSVGATPAIHNQFNFGDKKDPFKPYLVSRTPVVPASARSRRVSGFALPIHSFDVNQYKLIGVVTGIRENRAMVTDPHGKGYVLKVGMTIGKNEGRITSISQKGVTVLEQFRDDSGRVRKEYISINLPRKQ